MGKVRDTKKTRTKSTKVSTTPATNTSKSTDGKVFLRGTMGVCRISNNIEQFVDPIAERYHNREDANKSIVYQQYFDVTHREITEVQAAVTSRGWENLIHPPRTANKELVREFYANLKRAITVDKTNSKQRGQPTSVIVRETEVDISPAAIARELGIKRDGTSTKMLVTQDLSKIAHHISANGATPSWIEGETRRAISPKDLKPHLQVWNKIIQKNLQPSSRQHQINLDRIDTLFRIASGKPVNVGQLIWEAILGVTMHKKANFVFPQLITQLCATAEVPTFEVDKLTIGDCKDWDWETQKKEDLTSTQRNETKKNKKRKQEEVAREDDHYEAFEEEIMERGVPVNRKSHSGINKLFARVKELICRVEEGNRERHKAQEDRIASLEALIRESEAKRLAEEARHQEIEAATEARLEQLARDNTKIHLEIQGLPRQLIHALGQPSEHPPALRTYQKQRHPSSALHTSSRSGSEAGPTSTTQDPGA